MILGLEQGCGGQPPTTAMIIHPNLPCVIAKDSVERIECQSKWQQQQEPEIVEPGVRSQQDKISLFSRITKPSPSRASNPLTHPGTVFIIIHRTIIPMVINWLAVAQSSSSKLALFINWTVNFEFNKNLKDLFINSFHF